MDKKKTLTKEELDKLETFIQKINIKKNIKNKEILILKKIHDIM